LQEECSILLKVTISMVGSSTSLQSPAGSAASGAGSVAASGGSASSASREGAKLLQERLHQLLTRLSSAIDLIKNWPESDGDDASIHVETTTKLISVILEVTSALQRAEGVVKNDAALRKALKACPIPMDLLDLLDHGNGLNPDCFSRGLLQEALGQLAGLRRRKLALEMLGSAVEKGLRQREDDEEKKKQPLKTTTTGTTTTPPPKKKAEAATAVSLVHPKRTRPEDDAVVEDTDDDGGEAAAPVGKKTRMK
jgi:hypothetical protein